MMERIRMDESEPLCGPSSSGLVNAPVFVLGVHKSGTSLLRNLLDGHPALHVVPIECHFPYCLGLPISYPRRRVALPGPTDKAARIGRMLRTVQGYGRVGDVMADAYLPGRFDEARFVSHLDGPLGRYASAEDLHHYVDAIAVAMGDPMRERHRRIVEKSVDNIEHAWWLRHLYPDARFLLIVRDPYANLVSFRKFITRSNGFPSMVQPLRTLETGFHYAALHRMTLPGLHVLRYEDLVADVRKTMAGVSAFLGIPWDDVLLAPTSLGEPWTGNSTSGKPLHGVSAEWAEQGKRGVEPFEVELVARSGLMGTMRLFGYSPMVKKKGYWRPAKGERIRTYLRNRLYRIFADGS